MLRSVVAEKPLVTSDFFGPVHGQSNGCESECGPKKWPSATMRRTSASFSGLRKQRPVKKNEALTCRAAN